MDAFDLVGLIEALDTSRYDFAECFRAETLSLPPRDTNAPQL